MTEPMNYDVVTRDLCRLASQRVFDALMSVVQLADSDAQRAAISIHVMSAVAGAGVAAYAQWQGKPLDANLDRIDFLETVFKVAREASVEAEAAGVNPNLGGKR